MDRRATLSVCLAGALVMAGGGLVMWTRWGVAPTEEKPLVPETVDPAVSAGTGWPAKPEPAAAAAPAAPAVPASPAPAPAPAAPVSKKRNIRFSYRNSKPLKVELVASFNNWSPAAMTKGENHTWEISVPLDPGEYAYNFIVDGKVVRDPNNPRTAPEGRSLLVVRPL